MFWRSGAKPPVTEPVNGKQNDDPYEFPAMTMGRSNVPFTQCVHEHDPASYKYGEKEGSEVRAQVPQPYGR